MEHNLILAENIVCTEIFPKIMKLSYRKRCDRGSECRLMTCKYWHSKDTLQKIHRQASTILTTLLCNDETYYFGKHFEVVFLGRNYKISGNVKCVSTRHHDLMKCIYYHSHADLVSYENQMKKKEELDKKIYKEEMERREEELRQRETEMALRERLLTDIQQQNTSGKRQWESDNPATDEQLEPYKRPRYFNQLSHQSFHPPGDFIPLPDSTDGTEEVNTGSANTGSANTGSANTAELIAALTDYLQSVRNGNQIIYK